MDKRAKGRGGEDAACAYLAQKGYEIVKRNYYTRYGEVDIIAKYKDFLVFIEVKKRTSTKFGTGAQAVTSKKIWRIRLCAGLYLQEKQLYDQKIRFDVIDILDGLENKMNHIEAAF